MARVTRMHICAPSTKALAFCFTLWLAAMGGHATAQDELGSALKQVSPEEASSLRALLAAPLPTDLADGALKSLLRSKQVAGEKLGDSQALLALYRSWEKLMPATLPRNNFAIELMRAGEINEGLRTRTAEVNQTKPGPRQEHVRVNLVGDLKNSGRIEEAAHVLALANANIALLKKQKTLVSLDTVYLLRTESRALRLGSEIHSYYGRKDAALRLAITAVEVGRNGFASAKAETRLPQDELQKEVRYAAGDLASALSQLTIAWQDAGRYGDADRSLRQQLELAKTVALEPRYFNEIYVRAASLRFDQHEFVSAERYYLQADQLAQTQGLVASSPTRVNLARMRIATLLGQHRWSDALDRLASLDAAAQNDAPAAKRFQMPLERGYTYLGSHTHLDEAATLFEQVALEQGKRYPQGHFYVAQAKGLQGVALWKGGDPKQRPLALTLMQDAIRDYMQPDNFSYEAVGLRADIRALIFATALDATFASPTVNRMDLVGPADWVRGGAVQEAVADAALRSAAVEPALAELVRSAQDAKNTIEALRKILLDDALAPADVQSKMRIQVSDLEISNKQLQIQIQARFPDYARLVRPMPPGVNDLKAALAEDEALLMLLPTEQAVYVWALTRDGPGASARVVLPRTTLRKLVNDLRGTLDFATMGNVVLPFNSAAASTLYERLLRPVEAALTDKRHLVVAAGDALGQVPFGLLLTKPTKTLDANAPWLIKQAAITHVPSLSAWLAVKQLSKVASAPDALVAWGDPVFGTHAHALAAADPNARDVRLVDLDQDDAKESRQYADIPTLPETRDELLAIAKALQADPQRDLHLGNLATKASVLASSKAGELQKKKVIVFATHGLMAGDLPRLTQPALALAATAASAQYPLDALLTLDDVLTLKLNADWVVLSACNTASADGKGEEALSGLARGFLYAGSRSLLVTHWAVESESAKLLTTGTLTHYATQATARKAESLRQAMLSVMADKRYSHPAFWAPYALVGDGGR
ncbi:CHAT domain-containing protein [Rhodoferax aquaticus]|uniref:CHAT domain-containing protein n=1 Tax=Rhodoferax aquaticus TaxID=2527691 RepID=A0A515EJC1_9BURK|nr:CHAT domain-containing protein [Rhodoferax aquaticus]QDL52763.1 CHAT domain-containing protein [Rhodoferax aquaticus]